MENGTLNVDNRPFVGLAEIEGNILRVHDTDANTIFCYTIDGNMVGREIAPDLGLGILNSQIEAGEIETTGKPVSIEEVISYIEVALKEASCETE